MRISRRIMSIGATVALALAGILVTPAAASASTLTVKNTCYQTALHTWQCDLTISGGTLPYTTTWAGDGIVTFTYTDTYHAQGKCGTFTNHHVEAYVTDGTGTQAPVAYGYFSCTYDF